MNLNQKDTYVEIFVPKDKVLRIIYEIVLLVSFSLLIGFSAKIKIFLPFTPVPITFQTFAVLLLSMLLGSIRSLFVLLLYIFQGIIGVPLFASGGGVFYLLGPTGGYIVGFLVAGFVVGFLAEKGFDKKFVTTIFAMFIGNLIIYFFGVLWLTKFVGSIDRAIMLGVIPFVFSDIIKTFLSGIILPFGWKLIKKLQL